VTFTVRNSSFAYGAFLTDVLAFLISALVVYYVLVVPVTRLIQRSSGTRQRPTATAPSAR
jgi:large conductance mechanosensitive channel